MNAYELADGLSKMYIETDNHGLFNKRIQNMLRQQAEKISNMEIWEKKYLDRIAELEQEKIRAYDNGYEDGQKALQNQADRIAELEKKCKWYDDTFRLPTDKQGAEPFIWLKQDFDGEWIEVHPNKGIPLYTTPQIKELSDEEITEVLNDENIAEYHQGNWLVLPYAFARAILKKASEK